MLFEDFATHANGTYAAYLLSAKDAQFLHNWFQTQMKNVLNEVMIPPSEYHCTIIYSEAPFPQIETMQKKMQVKAKPLGLNVFGKPGSSKFIVLQLDSPDMTQLHEQCIKDGATSTFAQYHPHISLFENYSGNLDLSKFDMTPLHGRQLTFDDFTIRPLEKNDPYDT